MAIDLFRGKTNRNWAREPDRSRELTTVPTTTSVKQPYEDLVDAARELSDRVKVKPSGGGAVVATKIKWG